MAAKKSPDPVSASIVIGNKLSELFTQVQEKIRERAYHNFLGREPGEGDSTADWLSAQWEVVAPVELVVKEQKNNVVVEADLKGFSPKEIEIEVDNGTLAVFGAHSESGSSGKGDAATSTSETVYFYESVPLPCPIDPEECHAKLFKNGKLKVTLPKKT